MDKKSILGNVKFGTGGWRGIIGDDFIKYNIQRVAYAIGLMAKKEGKTVKIPLQKRWHSAIMKIAVYPAGGRITYVDPEGEQYGYRTV